MLKVNLTERDLKCLYEFLNRTNLKGEEVPFFNGLMQKLGETEEDKTEELKKEIEDLRKIKKDLEDKELKGKNKE